MRFTLVYLSDYGEWDSHTDLKDLHAQSLRRVDKPIAGLLKDLKRRGLTDDTLGRLLHRVRPHAGPGSPRRLQRAAPAATTTRTASRSGSPAAGIKGGIVHGATDELGFHAVEHPHYVTDIHATVLHLLGLDPRRLDVPGRKRLEIDYGQVIHEILA